jgi:quinol monooxygenase YgiN
MGWIAANADSAGHRGGVMTYGYIGSMRTKAGHRDDVVSLLLRGVDGLRAAGCQLYVVSGAQDDPDMIWVSEVWETKEHHDASLQLPEVKAAISTAMPMLTGDFTSQELNVVGGLGL